MLYTTTFKKTLIFGAAFGSVGAMAAGAEYFANGQSFYGQAVEAVADARVVDLATAGCFTVAYGDTVQFVSGSNSFTWQFDGLGGRGVYVRQFAPRGIDAKDAMAHILKDPQNRR